MTRLLDKVLVIAGFILLCSTGLLYWRNSHLAAKVEKLESTTVALQSDAAAGTVHESGTIKVAQQKEKAHVAVDQALANHPDWAAEPVPDDVAKLLYASGDPAQ